MIFISRDRSPSYVVQAADDTPLLTRTGPAIPGKRIEFRAFADRTGMLTGALPCKGASAEGPGRALGWLDPVEYSKSMIERERLSPEEIIEFLFNHPMYGVDFVAIDDNGKAVAGEDRYFIPVGDGSFHCWLCDKKLETAQAVSGHRGSAAHQSAVEETNLGVIAAAA